MILRVIVQNVIIADVMLQSRMSDNSDFVIKDIKIYHHPENDQSFLDDARGVIIIKYTQRDI